MLFGTTPHKVAKQMAEASQLSDMRQYTGTDAVLYNNMHRTQLIHEQHSMACVTQVGCFAGLTAHNAVCVLLLRLMHTIVVCLHGQLTQTRSAVCWASQNHMKPSVRHK